MITPQFSLDQNDQFVFVNIRAPYIKASMIQFEVEGDLFVFSLPPYYLRLHLPGQVVEDEHMSSSYDLETSTVKCIISKKSPGEQFQDLNMLSKLLARKDGPKIEEMDPDNEEETIDFEEIDQTVPEPLLNGTKYGFNNAYNEIIGVSVAAGNEINELEDPERASTDERRQQADALVDFDVDYYFSDLYENPNLVALINEPITTLTLDQDRLLKLPKRKVIAINPKETYIGLVPLLFAQAYDCRINGGDPTVESAWCVGKLCPLMSCLLTSNDLKWFVVNCTKRSLVFPLYRNWDLAVQVWKDVLHVLKGGKQAVLERLVYLLSIFENEQHLCYRSIWLEDYALWIQYANDEVILGLIQELDKALASLSKKDMRLDLEEYEEAAQEAMQEHAMAGDSDDESD